MQRDVLGDRELEHEAPPLPVLGDVPDAGVEHLARARVVGPRAPRRGSSPLSILLQSGDRVDQLRLAVAVHARDADDLAGSHVERDAADLLDAAVVAHVQVFDRQQHVAGLRR